MILNGNTIKKFIMKNELIENANLENIRSSSYDVTTTNYILKFKKISDAISFTNFDSIDNMYEKVSISNYYELKPNETILVPLIENFNIPNGICGHFRGRTTFNRLGIFISNQHLNPGYKGNLNLTITNKSPNTYQIPPNINIAQVVFEELNSEVSENLLYYNEKAPFTFKKKMPLVQKYMVILLVK